LLQDNHKKIKLAIHTDNEEIEQIIKIDNNKLTLWDLLKLEPFDFVLIAISIFFAFFGIFYRILTFQFNQLTIALILERLPYIGMWLLVFAGLTYLHTSPDLMKLENERSKKMAEDFKVKKIIHIKLGIFIVAGIIIIVGG